MERDDGDSEHDETQSADQERAEGAIVDEEDQHDQADDRHVSNAFQRSLIVGQERLHLSWPNLIATGFLGEHQRWGRRARPDGRQGGHRKRDARCAAPEIVVTIATAFLLAASGS